MKRILTVGSILILVAASVFATNTRVLTMGDNNNIMVDDANVFLYPGRTFDYPNLGIGEFAGADFNQFGFAWKFGEKKPWVMAIYFAKGTALQPRGYGDSPVQFGAFYNLTGADLTVSGTAVDDGNFILPLALPDNRRIDWFYGRKLGGVNFGFNLGYVSSSVKNSSIADKSEEGFSNLNFNVGLTSQNGDWDLAVGYMTGTWTDRNAAGLDESKPDGYWDLSARARLFHKINQTLTLVPHATLAFGKHGQKQYFGILQTGPAAGAILEDTTAYKSKLTLLDGGCGVHYMPVTNVLAVLDFGLQYNKVKDEISLFTDSAAAVTTTTTTMLPYWKIGLEGDVFNWLDVRFGAISDWKLLKVESDQLTSVKRNLAQNTTYLGFGFNWNRLHVDAYSNPQLFLDGFNFVSGANDNMNIQLSVLYEMF